MSSQETSFYDFDVLTQASSRATKEYITDPGYPLDSRPGGRPPRHSRLLGRHRERRRGADRLGDSAAEPFGARAVRGVEGRYKLLGDFLAERRAGPGEHDDEARRAPRILELRMAALHQQREAALVWRRRG